uniref:Uncharacterized protein n=1 Tax=Mycena chlorophos TaxID=658473 RepID=A0ABQ0LC24_MYCCL|nr:predicted protein [Mycena chlorophos]
MANHTSSLAVIPGETSLESAQVVIAGTQQQTIAMFNPSNNVTITGGNFVIKVQAPPQPEPAEDDNAES